MSQSQTNSIVTTSSGVFGGLGKVILTYFTPLTITFQSTCEVIFYAAISALVGYGVKVGIDKIKKFFTRKRK